MTSKIPGSILLMLALGAPLLAAQAPSAGQVSAPAQSAATSGVPSAPRAVADSYVIGPSDSLAILVVGEDDLTGKYRVDDSGMITFPYLSRIPAAGKTIVQFQEELTKRLSGDYLKNPQVRVDVDSYKSQSVLVSGSVRSPGRVTMTGQLTLLAALVEAGSPTADAGDDIQVAHRKDPVATAAGAPASAPVPRTADSDVVHVRYRDLRLGNNNLVLQDGDIVFVTPAQHFTITGQVRNTGSYVWEADLTLEQAIARAGGLTERGSTRSVKAHRTVDGKTKDVDLKLQDPVLPGDTIQVGQRLF